MTFFFFLLRMKCPSLMLLWLYAESKRENKDNGENIEWLIWDGVLMEIRRVEDSFLRIKKKGFIDTHCTKIFSSMGLHRQCNGNRIKSFLSFHLSDFFFYTSSINGRLMIYWSNRKTRQCLANPSKKGDLPLKDIRTLEKSFPLRQQYFLEKKNEQTRNSKWIVSHLFRRRKNKEISRPLQRHEIDNSNALKRWKIIDLCSFFRVVIDRNMNVPKNLY